MVNLPVRVPTVDWAKVATGEKRQFRTYCARAGDRQRPVVPPDMEVPRPVLLYTARHNGLNRARRWEAIPGILFAHRQEPLGSITFEDLAAEGFEFLPAFKFYWKRRYQKIGWRPTDLVSVLEVRPLRGSSDNEVESVDEQWCGQWLLRQLYGEWS